MVRERESEALERWLFERPERASSVLARVEVARVARRFAAQLGDAGERARRERELLGKAADVLAAVSLVTVDERILDRSVGIDPPALASADAVHVATALTLEELDGLVTYDARMRGAAEAAGLTVYTPGAS